MTKKHFEAIAKIMQINKPLKIENHQSKAMWQSIALDLSKYFERINLNFDRARFLKVCKGE